MPTVPFVSTLVIAILLAACGSTATSTSPPTITPEQSRLEAVTFQPPVWRYVNSGWVSPSQGEELGALSQRLRVFVITSEEELDDFEQSFALKRTWGTTTSLGRVDFPNTILLAAYYLWRPYQGDPLSVVGFSLEGAQADVLLELEESPQGKEHPYLYAPMVMVAVERSHFPAGKAVEFVFYLNGEAQEMVIATVD